MSVLPEYAKIGEETVQKWCNFVESEGQGPKSKVGSTSTRHPGPLRPSPLTPLPSDGRGEPGGGGLAGRFRFLLILFYCRPWLLIGATPERSMSLYLLYGVEKAIWPVWREDFSGCFCKSL